MGYLDNAGLQYLWGKLKEKFAPKSHIHDDRYYTEAEMDGKLNSKSNTGHTHDDRYYTESEMNAKLDGKLSLSGGTMDGKITLGMSSEIVQKQYDTSYYTSTIQWYKNAEGWSYTDKDGSSKKYAFQPQIGQHNIGGDGTGSITILPYPSNTAPWGGSVGLFVRRGEMKLDGDKILSSRNYSSLIEPAKIGAATTNHTHDDRYYTESEVNGKLGSKVDNTEAGANGLFSKLGIWTAPPTDDTYFIRQDTGGGNTFGRVKFSTIWNYIKGKTDGVYQPKGSYSTTDTKNTAGSTNTTSKLYLIGATSQSANPQTYSNASVYTTGGALAADGIGKDGYIAYPGGGFFTSYDSVVTGYCKIILPVGYTNTMMSFAVTIYDYTSNESVDYKISGYNYSGNKTWYNPTAVCVGKAGASHSNLTVRFGDNGSNVVIAIGESTTRWDYPQVVVHDVLLGFKDYSFNSFKSGWSIVFNKQDTPNVSQTILNTHVGYNAITSWDKIQNKPSSFTPASHTHDDRYYTESEMNAKLDGKSNIGHTHDDRYYTESEINSKLSGKANSNHSHYSITTVADNKNTNTTPNDYRNTLIFQGLKYNSKINSPSSDTYSYLLGLRGWNDSSGGNSHELAFNNTGVYWRNGSSEWGGWNRIYADNYHPNADYATNAGSANSLSGLSSRSSQSWGVQTGTFVHGEGDSTDGDFAFRRDCPNAGQLSMVLDGRFYQNEGQYRVLDTSDEPNLNVRSANFAKETYINRYKTVNLTDLDQNTWYPVTGTGIPYNGLRRFKCNVQLNSGSKPSWSTHSAGFTAVVDILEESSGWGTTNMQGMVLVNDQCYINDSNKPPVGYGQLGNSSIAVWWLRGGGTYFLAADYDCTWTIRKSTYTNNGQSVSPTTTYPGVSVNRSTITANLNGNAKTATNATNATNAANATNTQYLNNDSQYMCFHWNGQSGQPTWLWGGNDASNMYVYNPSNFSVNYATTAGSASQLNGFTIQASTSDLTAGHSKLSNNVIYIVYE